MPIVLAPFSAALTCTATTQMQQSSTYTNPWKHDRVTRRAIPTGQQTAVVGLLLTHPTTPHAPHSTAGSVEQKHAVADMPQVLKHTMTDVQQLLSCLQNSGRSVGLLISAGLPLLFGQVVGQPLVAGRHLLELLLGASPRCRVSLHACLLVSGEQALAGICQQPAASEQ